MKKGTIISAMLALCIVFASGKMAEAYTGEGDTLWGITPTHGALYDQIIKERKPSKLHKKIKKTKIGKSVTVSKNKSIHISKKELHLLASLIESEASGESFKGKVGVGAVVLNRVKNKKFPDSISAVIYEPGQFTPVMTGSLKKPSKESIKAAKKALGGYDDTHDALFYYNKRTATNHWLDSRPVTVVIGNHTFTK
ncbi:cell wall hydrolase [Fictibacillus sp. Mic-4]|uniref:cell wall hydrolase n=1 Tax=Fictibacillus TaxID=1329200 RepID=UPI0004210FE2|nr:cell wall hydrolase [Fictibacillus gelatini]